MTNGYQTHQTLILLITMFGELCLNDTRHFNPSQNHRRAEESLANNIQGGSKKIPHRTIYNISATSGLLLKILEAA